VLISQVDVDNGVIIQMELNGVNRLYERKIQINTRRVW